MTNIHFFVEVPIVDTTINAWDLGKAVKQGCSSTFLALNNWEMVASSSFRVPLSSCKTSLFFFSVVYKETRCFPVYNLLQLSHPRGPKKSTHAKPWTDVRHSNVFLNQFRILQTSIIYLPIKNHAVQVVHRHAHGAFPDVSSWFHASSSRMRNGHIWALSCDSADLEWCKSGLYVLKHG